MRRVAVGVAGIAVLGLVGGGLWAAGQDRPAPESPPTLGPTQAVAALTPLSDCNALLKHLKSAARGVVGPYGLDGGIVYPMAVRSMAADAAGSASSGAATLNEAAKAPDSTTNVQVAGVDESDLVKTDGDLMLAVVNGQLKIVRMNDGGTETLATWSDPDTTAQSVLVHGTRAVVIGTGGGMARSYPVGVATDDLLPGPGAQLTTITVLDISDPQNPRVVQTLSTEGNTTSSVRLVGDELRFAVSASPSRIDWKQPVFPQNGDPGDQKKILDRATAANRKVLDRTTIDDWLPQATVTTDGQKITRDLVDCRNVSVPKTFSGLQTLSLVQIPIAGENPLSSWHSAAVLAADSMLYATADHAWLATHQWSRLGGDFAAETGNTQIHLFDTPAGGSPKYEGSGSVKGTLLNQFAMDEQAGVLRVATTVDGMQTKGQWVDPDVASSSSAGPSTDNRLITLKPSNGRLVQEGQITGLGAGERIQGVRFVGDLAYVVTFRQTDPLYTVDLADPAKPVLRGELKIPGYSAYLHPVSAGRILGLGQDGTAGGQVTGLQLALFDVSGADATRLDRVTLDGAWSDAESDHHAFTMTGNLVLVPYSGPDAMSAPASGVVAPDLRPARMESGVLAVRVGDGTLGTPMKLATPANPMRAVVHDGDVYTLTTEGVAVHAPDGNGFKQVTVARF